MSYFRLSTLGVRTKPPRVLLFLLLHLTQIRVRRLPPHGSRTAKSRRNEVVYTNARNPSRNQRRQRGSFPPTSSRWFRCFDMTSSPRLRSYLSHAERTKCVRHITHYLPIIVMFSCQSCLSCRSFDCFPEQTASARPGFQVPTCILTSHSPRVPNRSMPNQRSSLPV